MMVLLDERPTIYLCTWDCFLIRCSSRVISKHGIFASRHYCEGKEDNIEAHQSATSDLFRYVDRRFKNEMVIFPSFKTRQHSTFPEVYNLRFRMRNKREEKFFLLFRRSWRLDESDKIRNILSNNFYFTTHDAVHFSFLTFLFDFTTVGISSMTKREQEG